MSRWRRLSCRRVARPAAAVAGYRAASVAGGIPFAKRQCAMTLPEDFPRWSKLKVVAKTKESEIITSFYLQPVGGPPIPSFVPGQFLAFRLSPVWGERPILRTYSLSSGPRDPSRLRISVKREARPRDRPDLPPGVGSHYLHDAIGVGDILLAQGPKGEFQLDRHDERPVVLISGGVGLTPLVSMLHELASDSIKPVWFIHACENGSVHAFGSEVLSLARQRPGITTHVCYRLPSEADRRDKRFDSEGIVTRALLQSLLPLDDYQVYLCGPPGFMAATYRLLRELGVAAAAIKYEFFGPATVLEERPRQSEPPVETKTAPPPSNAAPTADKVPLITFAKSGRSILWDGESRSLLDFAEAQGFSPDFSCRSGICSTCKTGLISGIVEYSETPLDPPDERHVLLCCSRPLSDVELDL
jgi:ferredoxin-NADP reductase